ncbi:MAG TPA: hypothetical protein VF507_04675 [Pyrinomonadaceae bacterium]|jgi:hypothetical protein
MQEVVNLARESLAHRAAQARDANSQPIDSRAVEVRLDNLEARVSAVEAGRGAREHGHTPDTA